MPKIEKPDVEASAFEVPETSPAETPKRTPAEIARELHPDCEDFRCNSAGDVTCKNGRGQTVLVPASKIAQYQ